MRHFSSRYGYILSLATIVAALLTGCGGSGGSGTNPPPPTITLTGAGFAGAQTNMGAYAIAGQQGFTFVVSGTGFTITSKIEWNGTPLTTSFADSADLNAPVTAAMVAVPGSASITVHDTATGATSNTLPFYIASPAAATAGVIQMITVAPDGTPANNSSLVEPSISATGRYVSFQSAATNLGAGPSSVYQQIYERDTCIGAPAGCTPSTIPISVTYDGSAPDHHSRTSSISGDGRYVAFDTDADNILPNSSACDTGLVYSSCVFVRDTCIGAPAGCTPSTIPVNVDANNNILGGNNPGISPDGRYVTFDYNPSDTSGDSLTGAPITYLRDTCLGAPPGCTPSTQVASQSAAGVIGNRGGGPQNVNTGGRYVVFEDFSTNLVPNDPNADGTIMLRDTCIGAPAGCAPSVTDESPGYGGAAPNNMPDGAAPSISADGRFVAYASDATNLVAQSVSWGTVYVRDNCFGAAAGCTPNTSLASIGNDGSLSNCGENNQSMSADGRFIAFASLASNLVPGDQFPACGWKDIFVRDTCFGAPAGCNPSTVRVSVTNYPYFDVESNAINDYPQISGDGHYLVFMSSSTNYLPTGGNGLLMVYLAATGF